MRGGGCVIQPTLLSGWHAALDLAVSLMTWLCMSSRSTSVAYLCFPSPLTYLPACLPACGGLVAQEGDAAAAPAAEIEEAPKKKAKTAKPRLVPTR